ncbi:hypothetical protein [Mangrovimonas spongiae]|uniref:Uncharacterized protein n=1 Tax=Mangrovimonas spongiae TaxID=2494697 RepID=A0A428K0M4_9FLAO|nr:hypothetical protein [Mangrovimonas spongiae]RSK39864.1 hypothetical protein EJA19_08255 [Mangrovimonas spongiae]
MKLTVLKQHTLKCFLILACIICSTSNVKAQKQTRLAPFKLVIKHNTNHDFTLTSLKGTIWKNLSFTLKSDTPQVIDEYGLLSSGTTSKVAPPNLTDFLFTITKTADGVLLKGLEGTTWTELSFSLPKNSKQLFTHKGMVK